MENIQIQLIRPPVIVRVRSRRSIPVGRHHLARHRALRRFRRRFLRHGRSARASQDASDGQRGQRLDKMSLRPFW
jgi:hypothetical protein